MRVWDVASGDSKILRGHETPVLEVGVMEELDEPIPELPAYDPEKDVTFDWEEDVRAAMETIKVEQGD